MSMDKIELRVVKHNGAEVDHHWFAVFGMAGGTVGRSGQNKLSMPDTGGGVSRVHAMVRVDAGQAYIANVCEFRPLWVDEQEVVSGEEVALALNATVRLGPYVLRALAPDTPFVPPATTPNEPPVLTEIANEAALAGIETPTNGSPPAIPLHRASLAAAAPRLSTVPLVPAQSDGSSTVENISQGLINFITQTGFDQLSENPEHSSPAFELTKPAQRDDLFEKGPAAHHELTQNSSKLEDSATELEPIDIDPVLPLKSTPKPLPRRLNPLGGPDASSGRFGGAHAVAAPLSNHANVHTDVPAAQAKPPDDTPPEPKDETAELARAFLEGAGLTPDQVQVQINPEFMRRFGRALRLSVAGTMDLLAARTAIRRNLFHPNQTVINPQLNNPLKLLPDADGVLMQLAGKFLPGFMPPDAALQEAYDDLRIHQLALMAGIQAAYTEALTRFDPTELAKQAQDKAGWLSQLWSTYSQAQLWERYRHDYSALRLHAEDDLLKLSGKTFLAAYEQTEKDLRNDAS